MKNEELNLQTSLCQLLDLCKLVYYSIPNGINIPNKVTQNLFNKTGRKKGVPDLHIPVPVYDSQQLEYLSTYVEVKLPGTNQTKKQKEWQIKLELLGHKVIVVRNVEELFSYLKKLYPNYCSRIKF